MKKKIQKKLKKAGINSTITYVFDNTDKHLISLELKLMNDLTFDNLLLISNALGTTDINIRSDYTSGSGGGEDGGYYYGGESWVTLSIDGIKKENL